MWMNDDRESLDKLLPELGATLSAIPFEERETRGSTFAIDAFRAHGGASLLVPHEFGGVEATAREAMSVQRAIGALAPSLAVASTMHHFSLSTLLVMAKEGGAQEAMLLEAIAAEGLLVASGFAEGRPGGNILRPSMSSERVDGGYHVSGSKKPCSLSASMDLLTASITVEGPSGRDLLGVALIPAEDSALTVTPFWDANALVAAQSDQVIIDKAFVADEMVVTSDVTAPDGLDRLQTAGLVWFEALMTASYIGVVSRLCELAITNDRVPAATATQAACAVEAAMAGIRDVAGRIDNDQTTKDTLGLVLMCRYAVQDALTLAVNALTEGLGGMSYVTSPEVGYVAESARCLAFHPPSRSRMGDHLRDHLRGKEFSIA